MRRWITNLIIAGYIGTLCYGLLVHALKVDTHRYLANYFVVWDMYGGWNTFAKRSLLVAEGESGQYYDVTPPWGNYYPYGSVERQDYDSWGFYSGQVAANTLKQTQHEPIVRVMLVEQIWSKKYNLPDHLWKQRFDESKDPRMYYYLRSIFDADGVVTTRHYDWESNLSYYSVIDNPALRNTMARSRPMIVTDQFQSLERPNQNFVQQASFESFSSSDRK